MEIVNENLLLQAFQNGINLFVGAGFSVLAENKDNVKLPTGNQLLADLQTEFKKPISKLSLSQLSSVLEATDRVAFYKYLTDRFSVKNVHPLYEYINKLNITLIPQHYNLIYL